MFDCTWGFFLLLQLCSTYFLHFFFPFIRINKIIYTISRTAHLFKYYIEFQEKTKVNTIKFNSQLFSRHAI